MEMLKSILTIVVYGNSVQSYVVSLAVMLGIIILLQNIKRILIFQLKRVAKKTNTDVDDFIISLINQIGMPVFIVIALYIGVSMLAVSDAIKNLIRYALIVVVTFRCILVLQGIVKYTITKLYHRRMKANDPATGAMVSTTNAVLRWIIWSVGLIFVLDNFGVNISALVAGIGIGGIAVAMASQAILGDAFSALSIFLDRPFEVGDFIIVDEHLGTVEHIGIKTTRIRSLSGEQLVFSNSDLTKSRIRNYKRMDTRRVVFQVKIIYETSPEKVKIVPQLIKDIFSKMEKVKLDRVHFQGFGDFALVYEVVYYVMSADYNIYMDKQQEINFTLMDIFEKNNIQMAYPTQTLYVKNNLAASLIGGDVEMRP